MVPGPRVFTTNADALGSYLLAEAGRKGKTALLLSFPSWQQSGRLSMNLPSSQSLSDVPQHLCPPVPPSERPVSESFPHVETRGLALFLKIAPNVPPPPTWRPTLAPGGALIIAKSRTESTASDSFPKRACIPWQVDQHRHHGMPFYIARINLAILLVTNLFYCSATGKQKLLGTATSTLHDFQIHTSFPRPVIQRETRELSPPPPLQPRHCLHQPSH